MKNSKYILLAIVLAGLFYQCDPDDDTNRLAPTRDLDEVRQENSDQIVNFLESHYISFEENPDNTSFERIRFRPIDNIDIQNPPEDDTPIIDSPFLRQRTVTQQGLDYEVYYLVFREGATEQRQPTFADSTLVTYEGVTIRNTIFDASPNPIWFDLTQTIRGFGVGITDLRGATSFISNPDGTGAFSDDFGIGAVFIPSGLGYFAVPPPGSGIRPYEPIYFTYQLYRSRLSDHDRDGIPSYMEDVNGTGRVDDVDTDGNGVPNFLDADDDGDGVPTRDEIIIEEDGTITFPDSNGNGTPDYLDPTYPE